MPHADAAEADDADALAGQKPSGQRIQAFAPPAGAHEPVGVRDPAQQREQEADRQLANRVVEDGPAYW